MTTIDKLQYNKPVLFDFWINKEGMEERIYFSKSYFPMNNQDQYFFKMYRFNENKKMVCLGYVYFYLDFENRKSTFIGALVKREYRGLGYSSVLTAYWIKFCLDNGFETIITYNRQRKPFLLYMLKKFSFEIEDELLYDISPHVIYICKNAENKNKCLIFRNKLEQQSFINGTIFKEDNYEVLDELSSGYQIVDRVLLSNIYQMQDLEKAYSRSLEKRDKHKKGLF